jgi:uncharacterized protein
MTLKQRILLKIKFWIKILLGFYVVVVAVMWWFENRLVYHPSKAEDHWEQLQEPGLEDVDFQTADGTKIHAWYLPKTNGDLCTVIFHGNAGNLSNRGELMRKLRDTLGTNTFVFDYPGFGKSEGTPNEQSVYASCEAALEWLKAQKGYGAKKLIFYAESIGSGAAIEMAKRHGCAGLILIKGFTTLPKVAKQRFFFVPTEWLMSNRFHNIEKIPAIHCPIMILGSTGDRVVPFSHSEELFAAANEPKAFYRDEGNGHNNRLPEEFWPKLGAFFAKHIQ